jgi:hypothetical protein
MFPTGLSPTICFSFYWKQIPKGSKYLKFELNQLVLQKLCSGQKIHFQLQLIVRTQNK